MAQRLCRQGKELSNHCQQCAQCREKEIYLQLGGRRATAFATNVRRCMHSMFELSKKNCSNLLKEGTPSGVAVTGHSRCHKRNRRMHLLCSTREACGLGCAII